MIVYTIIDCSSRYFVALRLKTFVTVLLLFLAYSGFSQRIVVDSTSSNKYLKTAKITAVQKQQVEVPTADPEPSFGDRALSIGKGIMNRLKARLNLEEATQSIKDKKERLLGKSEEETTKSSDGGG